jgi:hypothetical protein
MCVSAAALTSSSSARWQPQEDLPARPSLACTPARFVARTFCAGRNGQAQCVPRASHLQHVRAERLFVGVPRGDFECVDQHFPRVGRFDDFVDPALRSRKSRHQTVSCANSSERTQEDGSFFERLRVP